LNYIASVDNQGCTVRFMLYTQKLTAQVFIHFLERLIAEASGQIVWIARPSSATPRLRSSSG